MNGMSLFKWVLRIQWGTLQCQMSGKSKKLERNNIMFREMKIFNKRVPFDEPVKKNKLPICNASNTKGQSAKSE